MDGCFRFRFCGRLMVSFSMQAISFISLTSRKASHKGRRDPIKGKGGMGRDDLPASYKCTGKSWVSAGRAA